MKVQLLYLHVVKEGYPEAAPPEYYAPFSRRWAHSYKTFKSGYPCGLTVVYCGAAPTSLDCHPYEGIDHDQLIYTGTGSDIGACQWAMGFTGADLVVCMSTPVYFWRSDWLKRLMEAVFFFGDGLYGAMTSNQQSAHVRTCFWAVNPVTFRDYPHQINSRLKCCRAESSRNGDMTITRWFETVRKPSLLVTWDGVYDRTEWRKPENIFRKGDQSNCLVRDRHWDIYQASDYPTRLQLEIQANGL